MRPDAETNNAFVYCLAIAAHRHHVEVIGFGMMSNHAHVVVCDPAGQLPLFLQLFHRLFACHQNALRKRTESFWAANQPTSVVDLLDGDTVIEKLVYSIANPVKDLLVDKVEHWPGPNALAAIVANRPLKAKRPKRFFSEKNTLPSEATLELSVPSMLAEETQATFAARVASRVDELVSQVRERRIAEGRRVLGRSQILGQHWNSSPATASQRKGVKPRFAGRGDRDRDRALRNYRMWLDAYYSARESWKQGDREACFPEGVWWLKMFAGVKCEEAPATQQVPGTHVKFPAV